MSFVGSQRQTYLGLAESLRPHWRHDPRLPERIQKTLAREKRFGSRDRRLYRELLYTTLRFLPWVESDFDTDPERAAGQIAWLAADLPATRQYRAELTADWPECPTSLADKAAHLERAPLDLLPEWFAKECPAASTPTEVDTLHQRASLWLRLQNPRLETVTDELTQRGWSWRASGLGPEILEVTGEADVTQTAAYQNGNFEIQDLGSQLILDSITITPGERWLDACAGAGGKSLQLAHLLGSNGRVLAHDIRAHALHELTSRAHRAGLKNIATTTSVAPDQLFDGVLVDAPCSGSGTWRRSPHLKWVTTHEKISAYAARQQELLALYAGHVLAGGRLVYATCSLTQSENEGTVAHFLATHSDFQLIPPDRNFGYRSEVYGMPILPSRHNTDGFFVASLRRA